MRAATRLAAVVGIVLSTSLVINTGQSASAYASSPGGIPFVVTEAGAGAATALVSGAGAVFAGTSALPLSDVRSASASALTVGATGGIQLLTEVGTVIQGGAVIGLGKLPGLKSLFGSSSPALPAATTVPAGTTNLASPCSGYTSNGTGTATTPLMVYYTGVCSGSNLVQVHSDPAWWAGTITYRTFTGASDSGCTTLTNSAPNAPTDYNIGPFGTTGAKTIVLYRGVACGGPTNPASNEVGRAILNQGAAGSTDNNPLRWIESTGHCKLPNGTVRTVTTSSSTFTRATTATGIQESPAAPEVICAAGEMLIDATSDIVTTGSSTRVPIMAPYTANVTIVNKLVSTATGNYADCLTTLCGLHIQQLSPDLDCSTVAPSATHPCRDWATDPNRATKFECRYGTHVLTLADCAGLSRVYQYSPTVAPNTGSSTALLPATSPEQQSGVNTDPTTGLPSTDITTGVNPDTGDTAGKSCMGGAWSWNPVNWVYVPIKCALQWAFVPDTATMTAALDEAHENIETSDVGQLFTAFGDFIGVFVPPGDMSETGCAGPGVTIPELHLDDYHPLSACAEPMATLAHWVKGLLTVAISIGVVMVMVRGISNGFGMRSPFDGGSAP